MPGNKVEELVFSELLILLPLTFLGVIISLVILLLFSLVSQFKNSSITLHY